MRLLVIGSKGFIGINCVERLSQNHEVWQCDIMPHDENANYFHIDSNTPDFSAIFRNYKFDACINCSGAANVPLSMSQPAVDFKLNTANVFLMLDAIRTYNPDCKFLNLSSAAVYGNPRTLPVQEGQTVAPVSPYGYHKLMAETICMEFYQFWNIPTCSLRIFSAYGPGLKKQLLWDISQKLRLNSGQLDLFGTGKETRDFIYIDDLVDLIDIIITKASFNGEIINAASGSQTSVSEIAELMKTNLESNAHTMFTGANREGDPLYWQADVSIIHELGFIPKVNIIDGVKNYCVWLKENGLY